MTAFHRFDIAAELLVELVHKDYGTTRLAKPSGDPFIPTGNHDERRLQVEGPLPLLLEIVSVIYTSGAGIFSMVMEAASARIARAHIRHLGVALPEVLRDGDVDLFGTGRIIDITIRLRI